MKYLLFLPTFTLLVSGCSTLNDSLQLGSIVGAAAGASATYAGYSSAGKSPTMGNVSLGAGVGAAVGLLASYFIHREVEKDRAGCELDQVDMNFGDLPPSPFIVPKSLKKGGVR